ncbi:hypothetical protein Vretimale_1766, partial [Volvox reticuliferus]
GDVTTDGSGGTRTAAAGLVGTAIANGSRRGVPPQMLISTMDHSSCTSSDEFPAEQLSFTSAVPPSLLRGKSRLSAMRASEVVKPQNKSRIIFGKVTSSVASLL